MSDYFKRNGEHISFGDSIFEMLDVLLDKDPTNKDLQPIVPNLIKVISSFFDDVQKKSASYCNKIMGSNLEYSEINDKTKADIQDKFREYYYSEYLPKVKEKK